MRKKVFSFKASKRKKKEVRIESFVVLNIQYGKNYNPCLLMSNVKNEKVIAAKLCKRYTNNFHLALSSKRQQFERSDVLGASHQINIDRVMFCPRGCRNEESLSPRRFSG